MSLPDFREEEKQDEIVALKLQILDLRRRYEQKIDYLKHVLEYHKKLENKYKVMVENISDVIWIFDLNTLKLVYVSPSVIRLTGFTAEEAMKNGIIESLVPESAQLVLKDIGSRLKEYYSGNYTSRNAVYQWRQYCKDGSLKDIEITANFIFNEEASSVIILGVSRDIQARKDYEDGLLEKVAFLQSEVSRQNDLFSIIEQQLKNPLAGLQDVSAMLYKGRNEFTEAEKDKICFQSFNTAKNLFEFVRDLMDWTNLERNITPFSSFNFDLKLLIDRIIERMSEEMLDKKVILKSKMTEMRVNVDIFMLDFAICTVIRKISDYSESGGGIIEIGNLKPKENSDSAELYILDKVSRGKSGICNKMFQINNETYKNGKDASQVQNFKLFLAKEYLAKNRGTIICEKNNEKRIIISLPTKPVE